MIEELFSKRKKAMTVQMNEGLLTCEPQSFAFCMHVLWGSPDFSLSRYAEVLSQWDITYDGYPVISALGTLCLRDKLYCELFSVGIEKLLSRPEKSLSNLANDDVALFGLAIGLLQNSEGSNLHQQKWLLNLLSKSRDHTAWTFPLRGISFSLTSGANVFSMSTLENQTLLLYVAKEMFIDMDFIDIQFDITEIFKMLLDAPLPAKGDIEATAVWLKSLEIFIRDTNKSLLMDDIETVNGAREIPQYKSIKGATSLMEKPQNESKCDILLVTVTDIETRSVIAAAKSHSKEDQKKYFGKEKTYFNLGCIGGARTFLVRSEMGSDTVGGSTITTRDAIWETNPNYVIMVGIAFGVDRKKQSIGDILVSRQLQGYELQRVGTIKKEMVVQPRGDKVTASGVLIDRFRTASLEWSTSEIEFCLMLSGQKLVDNVDFRDRLLELFPETEGGEMEGIGLYSASQSKFWIVVKAICDFADGKKADDKKSKQKIAAENAAKFVLFTISQGGMQNNTIEADRVGNVKQSEDLKNEFMTLIKQKDEEISKTYLLKISHAAHRFKDGTIGDFFEESSNRAFVPPPECYSEHEEHFRKYLKSLNDIRELLGKFHESFGTSLSHDFYYKKHKKGFEQRDKIYNFITLTKKYPPR